MKIETLPLAQVQLALQLMAVGVALRWMSGLYRGCISGSERLVWLGGGAGALGAAWAVLLAVEFWQRSTVA